MAEKKSALIIANSQYEDPILRQLIAPAQDAEALAQVLRDPAISGFEVQTILNAPRYKVEEEIDAFFADCDRNDLLLLYFSGHGITDEDGLLYYAACNTNTKRLRSTAVAANFVNDSMTRCRSRRQVLLLDCCHSGAFARAKASPTVNTGQHFGGKTSEEGRGRFVLTASDAYQYSFEGNAVEGQAVYSVFTQALVQGLRTGEADLNGDGLITLDELYEYVHRRVTDQTPQQSPRKWAYDVDLGLAIARNPHPADAPLPEDVLLAIDNFVPEARVVGVQRLDALLRGKHRGLATSALKALLVLKEDDSRKVASAAEKCLAASAEQILSLEEPPGSSTVLPPAVSLPNADKRRLAAETARLQQEERERERKAAAEKARLEQEERERETAARKAREREESKRKAAAAKARREREERKREAAAEKARLEKEESERQAASTKSLVEKYRQFQGGAVKQPEVPGESTPPKKSAIDAFKNMETYIRDDSPTAEEMSQKGDASFNSKNYPEAAQWYRKAAEQGNAHAQNLLGYLYDMGLGVEKDQVQAVQWYRKSAAQGNATAENNLGDSYRQGSGVEQDYAQALQWFRKSAAHGNSMAENNLGYMYQHALGVEQDYAQAVQWYRKAAEQGNANAQNLLGYFYDMGLGVKQDHVQAVQWYRKSAAQGNSTAENNLGDSYRQGLGVEKDYAQALQWFRKSAAQGNAWAENNLGYMYQHALGVQQDYAQALQWYRKSVGQGNSHAENNLGIMYQNGWGVEKDYAQALELYRKSAAQGNAYGEYDVGYTYENGLGVPKDKAEAQKWYQKAKAHGYKG